MYLTTENADQYVGKTLDAKRRRFHYYPLTVHKNSQGRYVLKDNTGTYMPVPTPIDVANSVYFDIVDGRSC